MALPDRLDPGRPDPLGANWDGLGVNFAVFSAHADRIELCLFDRAGRREIARHDLPECTDEVFHGYLPDARPGLLYGYRAHGPYQPEQGHRFNPNKLLLDPYARMLSGKLHWSDSLFGYRVGASRADLSFDRRDSAAALPKSVVTDDRPVGADHPSPRHSWGDTVIYEAHLRGLTMLCPDIDSQRRGTFAGLADPRVIDHLLKLGISAVELLPVQAFAQDRFLVAKNLANYWGYSTLSYFSPEPGYVTDPDFAIYEVRSAVQRLHQAGIEVILDVVYNHTCEGDEKGPTLCWRGLDNASYYRLLPERERYFVNDTGCGNTINITHPRVLQMVMDSLRYWVRTYQVDGFRFDLGPILGREASGFSPYSGFFDAVRQDPVLSQVKLISEPWDIGPGGYQLGNHPPGFAEWNDKFRDSVRRFWRGDPGQRPELARRLMGSGEIFDHRRRRPWASVNYAASHDGFPVRDVVSYSKRHNIINGENNSDGHGDNCSANWGVEGETDDPLIMSVRQRVARALLATVFVSHGTPMLLAGDEMDRTQRGNNNAYCQDNEISWLNWEPLLAATETHAQVLSRFTARLIELRRQHPSLSSTRYLHGDDEILPDVTDADWFDERGQSLVPDAWADPSARLLALRRAVAHAGRIDLTLTLLNASDQDQEFILPQSEQNRPQRHWQVELDTARPQQPPHLVEEAVVMVPAHSLVLVSARPVELFS
jgi:isoamylase